MAQGEFAARLSVAMSEGIPVKFHQQESPKMRGTRTPTVDMPSGQGKARETPTYTKSYRQLRNAGSGRKSSPGRAHQLVSPANIHTNNSDQRVFMHLGKVCERVGGRKGQGK